MENIKLSIDGSSNMTLLSNTFIDFYMKDANDAQIKLYLCLLRIVSSGGSADLSELADRLNYSEKDILRALKYWERRGVLSLSVDRAKKAAGDDYFGDQLLGIRLALLDTPAMVRTVSVSADKSIPSETDLTAIHTESKEQYALTEAAPAKEALPEESDSSLSPTQLPDPEACKAAYRLDDLRNFKNSPETSWVLTAAQQYIGRPLSPTQIRSLVFISDGLGFSGELIDYLLQYCVEKGQSSFRYIEATAMAWAEQGIRTVSQARHQEGDIPAREFKHIMSLLGRSGSPAPQEQRFMRRWLSSYAFPMEIIEEACSRAVLAVDANRFPYVETILKQWHDKGVKSMEDVAAADEAFRAGLKPNSPSPSGRATAHRSAFNSIEQQDYDFSELERTLVNKN